MPSYDDLKAAIETVADASGNPAVQAALGSQESSAPYTLVTLAEDVPTEGEDIEALAGSAWAPPADSTTPEDGPDPATEDDTVIATIIAGVAAYLEDEWKPKINAAIDQINSEHGTALDNVP